MGRRSRNWSRLSEYQVGLGALSSTKPPGSQSLMEPSLFLLSASWITDWGSATRSQLSFVIGDLFFLCPSKEILDCVEYDVRGVRKAMRETQAGIMYSWMMLGCDGEYMRSSFDAIETGTSCATNVWGDRAAWHVQGWSRENALVRISVDLWAS
jgi:hypothetical protein